LTKNKFIAASLLWNLCLSFALAASEPAASEPQADQARRDRPAFGKSVGEL